MEMLSQRVLLLGFGERSREPLEAILARQGRDVHALDFPPASQCLGLIEQLSAGVVFCAAEHAQYRPMLEAVRKRPSPVPVVVVGRAEVAAWLDALEAGASDYCSPPFEDAHVQWILQSASRPRLAAQAGRAA